MEKTETVGEVLWVDPRLILPMEDQPRTYFNPETLEPLGDSLSDDQYDAVTVSPLKGHPVCKYLLANGERRYRASIAKGLPKLKVVVRKFADPEDQFIFAVGANSGGEPLTPMDMARALKRMLGFKRYDHLGRADAIAAVARVASISPSMAEKRLALLTLPKEVQDRLEPTAEESQRITPTVADFIRSQIPDQKQRTKVAGAVAGMDKTAAFNHIRKFAADAGIVGRKQKPSDKFKNIETLVDNLGAGVDRLSTISDEQFSTLFARRTLRDRRLMHSIVQSSIKAFTRLERLMARHLKE